MRILQSGLGFYLIGIVNREILCKFAPRSLLRAKGIAETDQIGKDGEPPPMAPWNY